MSGSFVQRGECASFDKLERAKDAVQNGADIVLEIPFPYSSMTAEKFAKAGVDILAKSGMCSHLAFGSECADIGLLEKIADFLAEDKIDKCIQVYQRENPNMSYASVRTELVKMGLGEEYAKILSGSNDILGIEYIKAIKQGNYDLIPVAIKRTVDRKDKATDGFASSSHIRELLETCETDTALSFVPESSKMVDCFLRNNGFYEVLHTSLMTKSAKELEGICEISGGLEYAVVNAVKNSENYQKTVEKLKSKTTTDAKIRRMLLFAFMGVTKEMGHTPVKYTLVLADSGSQSALSLFRKARKERQIILARRVSEIRKDPDAFNQYSFCLNAEKILSSASKLYLAK